MSLDVFFVINNEFVLFIIKAPSFFFEKFEILYHLTHYVIVKFQVTGHLKKKYFLYQKIGRTSRTPVGERHACP